MIGAMEAVHSGTTTLCDDTNVAARVSQDPPVSAVTLFAFLALFQRKRETHRAARALWTVSAGT